MTWPGQVASCGAPGAMLLQASARSLAFNTLVNCLVSLDVGTSYISTAWDTSLVNIPCTVECLNHQPELQWAASHTVTLCICVCSSRPQRSISIPPSDSFIGGTTPEGAKCAPCASQAACDLSHSDHMTCPDWQLCAACCRRILKESYADALRRDRWMSVLTGKPCQGKH